MYSCLNCLYVSITNSSLRRSCPRFWTGATSFPTPRMSRRLLTLVLLPLLSPLPCGPNPWLLVVAGVRKGSHGLYGLKHHNEYSVQFDVCFPVPPGRPS